MDKEDDTSSVEPKVLLALRHTRAGAASLGTTPTKPSLQVVTTVAVVVVVAVVVLHHIKDNGERRTHTHTHAHT